MRFLEKHGTFVDNFDCKLIDNTQYKTSGVLIKTFLDHQPHFTFQINIWEHKAQHFF